MKPGIYTSDQLTNEQYHGDESIGSTGVKRILQSAAHFRRPRKFDTTRAKETGSAIHCCILEPERFKTDYRIAECDARTSPIYKAACKDIPKDRVFTSAEYENIAGMQKGVMRNKVCRELIELPGRYELSLFTKCPVTGVLVKCRYDKLTDSGMPVDLKKTQVSERSAFSRAIQAYGYHISAAYYMDLWEWQFGEKLDFMRWIAVEEQSPHAAMRYKINEESLIEGRNLYRQALNIYADCLDKGDWPAYGDQEEEVGIPPWAFDRDEEADLSSLEEV